MKKLLLASLACVLMARENPFVLDLKLNEPSEVIEQSEFSKVAFSFPKDARKLMNLTLEYLATDGSVKNYSIAIKQPIDWHKVYMLISEEELLRPSETPSEMGQDLINIKPSAPVVQDEKNPSSTQSPNAASQPSEASGEMPSKAQSPSEAQSPTEASQSSEASVAELYAQTSKELALNEPVDEIVINENLAFKINKNSVQILCKAKPIRQFSLNKPDRIVLDYKLIKGLKNKTFALGIGSFKALKIGIHDGFFRVVLNSDSKYDYHIKYSPSGALVKLK